MIFVTSSVVHSGHRFVSSSQRVQLPEFSKKHAISPRWDDEIGTSTSDTEKAMQVEKIVMSKAMMMDIDIMKAHIEMSLFRLCRVDMTGLALMNQPIMAARKKRAPVTRKRGLIQVASLCVLEFKTDDSENAKTEPKTIQLTIGRLIQAGTFDSRDFCTNGFDIMCSRVLTASTTCWRK